MKHKVVIVLGLSDKIGITLWLIIHLFWRKVHWEIYRFGWRGLASQWAARNNALQEHVNSLIKLGFPVSLIGLSAGASAAVNAFIGCEQVSNVVVVCGRLFKCEGVYPTLSWASRNYPIFGESVIGCGAVVNRLVLNNTGMLARVLTIRPWWDEKVPVSTVLIQGATNMVMPTIGHGFSIRWAMLFYRKAILRFIYGAKERCSVKVQVKTA
jgi:hypothetical protein